MQNTKAIFLANIVDELGRVQAEKAELAAREKELKGILIDANRDSIPGRLFNATVVTSGRRVVDWRAIAERLEASRQMIRAYTENRVVTAVRLTSRNKEAA